MKIMNSLLTFGILAVVTLGILAPSIPTSAAVRCEHARYDSAQDLEPDLTPVCYPTDNDVFASQDKCQASYCQGQTEELCNCDCEPTLNCTDVAITENAPASAGASGSQPVRKLIPRGMGDISLQTLAGRFINVMIGISGSIALLMFVYGGFMMLTSAGDSDKVGTGKKAMTWAVVGLIVIFGAYAILSALFTALGVGV